MSTYSVNDIYNVHRLWPIIFTCISLIQFIWYFHILGQIQLKINLLAEIMLKLAGVNFHTAMQP